MPARAFSLSSVVIDAPLCLQVAEMLAAEAARYDSTDSSVEAAAAKAPFLSFAEWRAADSRRHQFRKLWSDWLDPDAGGYDVLIAPVFATAAFPHEHSEAFHPFWRETGRTLMVDGEPTPYQRHVFWSALTGTCFLPSTAFPAGCGAESGLPIGLQVVGREGADYTCIDFCRLLEEEHGFGFVQPPTAFGSGAAAKM